MREEGVGSKVEPEAAAASSGHFEDAPYRLELGSRTWADIDSSRELILCRCVEFFTVQHPLACL